MTEPLSVRNVDQMVSTLLSLVEKNPNQNQALINSAKDIIARIDYGKIACWSDLS